MLITGSPQRIPRLFLTEDTSLGSSLNDFRLNLTRELGVALDRHEPARRIHTLDCAAWGRTEEGDVLRAVEDDILVHLLDALCIVGEMLAA